MNHFKSAYQGNTNVTLLTQKAKNVPGKANDRGKLYTGCGYQNISESEKTLLSFRQHLTFHVADLILTVRPLLVRVHFIRRKKLRSVFCSLVFLDPKHGQKMYLMHSLLMPGVFFCRNMLHTQKKKLLNELKKIRVNFSTKFNYIFPPKSNLFEMTCCNLVV